MFAINEPMVDYLRISMRGDYYARFRDNPYIQDILYKGQLANIPRYSGNTLEGAFLGSRVDKGVNWGLFQVGGHRADWWYAGLKQSHLLALDEESKCTRIDIQVTIPLPKFYYAVRFHQDLEISESRKGQIFGGSEDGYTVAIGSRFSDRYIRIYEKPGVTFNKTEWFLRFEVEYKGELADKFYREAKDVGDCVLGEVERVTTLPSATSMSHKTMDRFKKALSDRKPEVVKVMRKPDKGMDWLSGQVSSSVFNKLYSQDIDERLSMITLVYRWLAEVENSLMSYPVDE